MCKENFTTSIEFDWCNAMDALQDAPTTIQAIDGLLVNLEHEREEAVDGDSYQPFCIRCQAAEAADYERQVNSDWYYDRI
jgi:hypothetical protein